MDIELKYSSTFHSQIDGQTKFLNNLLRCLVGDKHTNWDPVLVQAECVYNNYLNRSTKKTPFEIVNGMHPKGTTELRDLNIEIKRSDEVEEFVDFIKILHEEMNKNLETSNQEYK